MKPRILDGDTPIPILSNGGKTITTHDWEW